MKRKNHPIILTSLFFVTLFLSAFANFIFSLTAIKEGTENRIDFLDLDPSSNKRTNKLSLIANNLLNGSSWHCFQSFADQKPIFLQLNSSVSLELYGNERDSRNLLAKNNQGDYYAIGGADVNSMSEKSIVAAKFTKSGDISWSKNNHSISSNHHPNKR